MEPNVVNCHPTASRALTLILLLLSISIDYSHTLALPLQDDGDSTTTQEPVDDPCVPSPCGLNAFCGRTKDGVPYCSCNGGFIGDPYVGCTPEPTMSNLNDTSDCKTCECWQELNPGSPLSCKPECINNTDCPMEKACLKNKCVNPCPGVCGVNALCRVFKHLPVCFCKDGYGGDPFLFCSKYAIAAPPVLNLNDTSDCKTCECWKELNPGSPLLCKPECINNTDCPTEKACHKYSCVDPCPGVCGLNAVCHVVKHLPLCHCKDGYSGDPFVICSNMSTVSEHTTVIPNDADCTTCECFERLNPGKAGLCKPECNVNANCTTEKACINNTCQDPCIGTCGQNAVCRVVNHTPVCSCNVGYTGHPLTSCSKYDAIGGHYRENKPQHPCIPSPCGLNTYCHTEMNWQSYCACNKGFTGDPYVGCRSENETKTPEPSLNNTNCTTCECLNPGSGVRCTPECTINANCTTEKTCINYECKDPCPGLCGLNANCEVFNHAPSCQCSSGYTGDPYVDCKEIEAVVEPTVLPISDEPKI